MIRRPTSSTWLLAGVPFSIDRADADGVAPAMVELTIRGAELDRQFPTLAINASIASPPQGRWLLRPRWSYLACRAIALKEAGAACSADDDRLSGWLVPNCF